MSDLQAVNSVFNIEIEKIDPNPNQPRKHFSEEALRDLAESIRRYGVMQPITVVRREHETSSGGMATRYEIVAGERRWRASVIAGMATIPAIIREEEESEQDRFELSVLENLQREDLNPVDKARSFERLVDEFGMRHAEIADKLGKSREYVTNSMRLLDLPDNILDAVSAGEISEGHTRPMLTIKEYPEELQVLFQEIKAKHLTVRQAEATAKALVGKGSHKRQSTNTYSSHKAIDPEIAALQAHLSDTLGTSVSIDTKDEGGKLTIDFFSRKDLQKLLDLVDGYDHSANSAQARESFAQPPQSDQNTSTRQSTPRSLVQEAGDTSSGDDDFVITRQSNHQFNTRAAADSLDKETAHTAYGWDSSQAFENKRQDIFSNSSLNSFHTKETTTPKTNRVEAAQSADIYHDTTAQSTSNTPDIIQEPLRETPTDAHAPVFESTPTTNAHTNTIGQTTVAPKPRVDYVQQSFSRNQKQTNIRAEDSPARVDTSNTHVSHKEHVQSPGIQEDTPLQPSTQGQTATPDSLNQIFPELQTRQEPQFIGRNQVQSNTSAAEAQVFGVESQSISDVGSDFIPGQLQDEIPSPNPAPGDLVVDGESAQTNTTSQSPSQESGPVSRDVQVTMGGLGMMDFIGTQGDQNNQVQNNSQDTATKQPDYNVDQSTQHNSSDQSQYTKDPYRLDNFSI